VERPEGAE